MRAIGMLAALAAVSIAACADAPGNASLAQRLDGKTPEQRAEILRRECLGEAEWDLRREAKTMPMHLRHSYMESNSTTETRHLKGLCREFPAVTADLGKTAADVKAVDLAEKCQKEISEHLNKESTADVAHFERFRTICEEVTGRRLGAAADAAESKRSTGDGKSSPDRVPVSAERKVAR